MKKILSSLLVCCALSAAAQSGLVSLAWDPSPSPGITNYVIYVGPSSRVYTNSVNAGNGTTHSFNNLVPGGIYFFTATAQDNNGLESDQANEVSARIPFAKPQAPINLKATSVVLLKPMAR